MAGIGTNALKPTAGHFLLQAEVELHRLADQPISTSLRVRSRFLAAAIGDLNFQVLLLMCAVYRDLSTGMGSERIQ